MKKSQFLTVALDAVKKAEKVILDYYSGEICSTLKADQTPVTLADTGAEKIIREIIKTNFPDHGFLGEEFGQEDNTEYTWIIDPIDGTKNFTRKRPVFATQLALMKNGEVILGVSNAPILKELIYAEKGQGTCLNGQQIHVSSVEDIQKAHFSFGGLKYFQKENKLPGLLSLANQTQSSRSYGDFWAYHLLAEGKLDIVVEANLKIWDIAALKIIVEESGGVMTDMNGKPVTKESTTVIATNGKLQNIVLEVFKTSL